MMFVVIKYLAIKVTLSCFEVIYNFEKYLPGYVVFFKDIFVLDLLVHPLSLSFSEAGKVRNVCISVDVSNWQAPTL